MQYSFERTENLMQTFQRSDLYMVDLLDHCTLVAKLHLTSMAVPPAVLTKRVV